MLMWSSHSFYSNKKICLIYSVSTLEFATLLLYSSQLLIASTTPPAFQVNFALLIVSANCTCKTVNKKFTGNKICYLNHIGRMSYRNEGTLALFEPSKILSVDQGLRSLVYITTENWGLWLRDSRAVVWMELPVGAVGRLALEEIFHLGNSIILLYILLGKLG